MGDSVTLFEFHQKKKKETKKVNTVVSSASIPIQSTLCKTLEISKFLIEEDDRSRVTGRSELSRFDSSAKEKMSSEIEVVDDAGETSTAGDSGAGAGAGGGEESLRNDVYTAAAYGDLEKLQRLVESEGCSVAEPDGNGYYALQWAALNNRTAAAQYIIEVLVSVFDLSRFRIWIVF